MHSEVTASDLDSMNAIFQGKISVITSYTKKIPPLIDTIKNLPIVSNGNGLYEVGHAEAEITYTEDIEVQNRLKQTEYRYAGQNPDNYVKFNNELWRIIGLVNTPEGQRVKIIRNESIGNYSWDTSASSVNSGCGLNEWSESDLMTLLNHGHYYQRNSGICYNGENNATTECDFNSTGLLEESKNMIDTITWNTGSNDGTTYQYNNISTLKFYNLERSNNTGKICASGNYCNDTVPRTTTLTGKIGLMYPSDYGYATSGGSGVARETCLTKVLYGWKDNAVNDCKSNNWIYDNSISQWAMLPIARSGYANDVITVSNNGNADDHFANNAYASFPTVYLQENVKVASGNGTMTEPYLLKI